MGNHVRPIIVHNIKSTFTIPCMQEPTHIELLHKLAFIIILPILSVLAHTHIRLVANQAPMPIEFRLS
jgi:hypothetical protein